MKGILQMRIKSFPKSKLILFILAILAFIFCLSLSFVFLSHYFNNQSLEIESTDTSSIFSIDKIVLYSNAYGINHEKNQARWNLTLSQYTDFAIYLNTKVNISNMYIDNISFTNSNTGILSLSSLSLDSFGKSPISNDENLDITSIKTPDKIDLAVSSPIFLRYLNHNLKENYVITDIDTPLLFDGSILKRGKVTLSSLKNTVSFTLHVFDTTNNEYKRDIQVPINFENKDLGTSIYDGSFTEEILSVF